jgi:hypothetical protein
MPRRRVRCLISNARSVDADADAMVAQALADVSQAFRNVVRERSVTSKKALQSGLLEPSYVEDTFREVAGLGREERRLCACWPVCALATDAVLLMSSTRPTHSGCWVVNSTRDGMGSTV